MSLRELRVLVSGLPADSATGRRLRGHAWGDIEYMLAEILDVVKFHRVEWAMSRGAKPAKPKPTARPKVADHGRQPQTAGDAADRPRLLSDRDLAHAAHQHVLELTGIGRGEG